MTDTTATGPASDRLARGLLPTVEAVVRRIPGTRQRVRALEARVAELEASIEENRRLNLRVAELTDLVAQTLLPADRRDDAQVQDALEQFLRES